MSERERERERERLRKRGKKLRGNNDEVRQAKYSAVDSIGRKRSGSLF